MNKIPLCRQWQFRQDPDNIGIEQGWFLPEFDFAHGSFPIKVPSCWEEDYQDYEGIGWYLTTFMPGTDASSQISRLVFEASNYRTTVWLNGHEVGTNEGGYTPFSFAIQDFLKDNTDNTIVVRVVSPIVTKDIQVDGLGPNDMPHWRGGLTAGIWQPVYLEFNELARIEDAFYKPDISSGSFDVELSVEALSAAKAVIVIHLADADGEPAGTISVAENLLQGKNKFEHNISLQDPVLWDVQNPHLYTATATLLIDTKPIDRRTERIGLREFTYTNERFYLNEKRIYLRGGFWEGVYAKHQSYPENREVIRKEISMAKAAGFNLLRPWRRPVPPVILEEADAAGLLIIASPPVECMSCWPSITPEMPARIEHEIRELVLRDRNHPSIIWWEMFNEVTRKELAELIPGMSLVARELDPTRLVLDESGGWASGAHFYPPGSTDNEYLCEVHSYVRAPVSDYYWNRYRTLGVEDTVEGHTDIKQGAGIFMSEFGFGGLPEFEINCKLFEQHGNPKLPAYRHHQKLLNDLQAAINDCGLNDIYPDVDSLCLESQQVQAIGNQRQLEALLANQHVSGYCLHAFTDGDWILGAGIIDHWQRPKAVYHSIQESNQLPRLLAFPEKRNLRQGESVSCLIVLRGETQSIPDSLIFTNGDRQIQIETSHWSDTSSFRETCLEIPASILSSGQNTIEIHSENLDGRRVSASDVSLYVMPPITSQQEYPVVVYDPLQEITPWLNDAGYNWISLSEWTPGEDPTTFIVVPDDVNQDADLPMVAAAMAHVESGLGSIIFLQPPAVHESTWMLEHYDAGSVTPIEDNRLFKSGTFPYQLMCRPSFAFWEAAMHVAREHPVFDGLPADCLMNEPYHEVAPVETFYQLDSVEAPSQTITWFRPEVIKTKAKKRTYLGGEDVWHGKNLAVVEHGDGHSILSTLILRTKIGRDPVAERILGNLLSHAESLTTSKQKVTLNEL